MYCLSQADSTKICYCVNPNEDSDLIGMGVFHINEDVRKYITNNLRALPETLTRFLTER